MRLIFRWLGWSAIAAGLVVILCVTALAIVLDRGLASFGLTPPEAYRVLRIEQSDDAAIREAEGPVHTPYGVAERGFIQVGGIWQWVTIRGEDVRNPAILVLHGGPGDPNSQLAYFFRKWERMFTIIQWDQRGAGRTYGRYGAATPDLSLNRLVDDGAEVANYAQRRLHQKKIVLLGHSWGSALGMHLIRRYADQFCAFVGTGQIVATADLAASYYQYALAQVTARHEADGIAELTRLGPPPYSSIVAEQTVRKWLNRFLPDSDKDFLLSSAYVSLRNRRYTMKDFRDLQEGHLNFSLPTLNRTYDAIDLNRIDQIPVPFFVIDGRWDRLTPPGFAKSYLQKIQAPQKAMFLIDGGHFAMMSNSDEFMRLLTEYVRPIVTCGPERRQASAN